MNRALIKSGFMAVAVTFIIIILVFVLLMPKVSAENQHFPFADPAEQQRFHKLTEELRCLVCQNQSLADSDAPLADDLRKEVYAMMQEGKDNESIIEFLVARYGEFVLYRPRVNQSTLLLWGAPVLLPLLGLLVLFFLIRRRADQPQSSGSDLQRVRKMLEEEEDS